MIFCNFKTLLAGSFIASTLFLGGAAADTASKWKISTSNKNIPEGWEPFAFDDFDEQDPFLLRRSNSAKWDSKQKWEFNTARLRIPEGWEPFSYDSNDEFDPVLLRRRTDKWDGKQKWEVSTAGLRIPVGWEPFAYDC